MINNYEKLFTHSIVHSSAIGSSSHHLHCRNRLVRGCLLWSGDRWRGLGEVEDFHGLPTVIDDRPLQTKRTIDNDTGVDAEVSFSTRMKYLRRLHRSYIASIVLSALTVLLVLYLASEQIALNRARKAGRSGLPRRGLPMFWELIVLVLWWAGWLCERSQSELTREIRLILLERRLVLSQYITANKAVWHCGSYGECIDWVSEVERHMQLTYSLYHSSRHDPNILQRQQSGHCIPVDDILLPRRSLHGHLRVLSIGS